MKLRKIVGVALLLLLIGFTVLFYSRALIHGGVFRKYLINNATLVCSLSLALLGLRFLHLRIALFAAGTMKRWIMVWAGLGLAVPVLLYPIDRFTGLDLGEPLLFTLWPTYIMFLAGDGSWSDIFIVMLSLAVNAAIYCGFSLLVWWCASFFQRFRYEAATTKT